MTRQIVSTLAAVATWENLYAAWRKAAGGKRGRVPAAAFEHKLEDNLVELQAQLENRSYRPGRYETFYIHEPKRRLISAAPFRDRVVHHALCRIIEPSFERGFIEHSYANRVGKGTHRALDTCQRWLRQYRYVLPCDVRQFFPSIDHAILRGALHRRLQDAGLRWLVDVILESGAEQLLTEYTMVFFPEDDLFAVNRPRGLPIGNLTSQFWANCYLNEIDHFVTRELGCRAYLRYVDDLLLFDADKRRLWSWRDRLIERLERLRLVLHQRRAQVRPTSGGVRFLGFVLYPTHRRLLRRKGIHFRRKMKRLVAEVERGDRAKSSPRESLQGWINHVRYGDTWGLRRALLAELRL